MNASDMLRQLQASQTKAYSSLLAMGSPLPDNAGDPAKIFGISQVTTLSANEADTSPLLHQPFSLVQIFVPDGALRLLELWLKDGDAQSDVLLYGADPDLAAQASWRLAQQGYRCICQSSCSTVLFFTRLPVMTQHIVMTATADNYHFAEPIISLAREEGHRLTKLSLNGLSAEGLYGWLRHCDVAWFEWGDSAVIAASHLPKHCRIICRIHRYELYDDTFLQANWANVDEVIFVSEAMKRRFEKRLGDKLPATLLLSVIANLTTHALTKPRHQIKANPFHIGCVARIVGVKNLFFLLPIMQALIEHDPRYQLFIVGRVEDPCLYEALTEAIEHAGLGSAIRIEGVIPADKMARWYEDKSYLLSTSYSESQGMGILEAMLAGVKPVAFAASGGLQEYLPSRYQFISLSDAVDQLTTPPEPREIYVQEAVAILNQREVAQTYASRLSRTLPSVHFTIVIPTYNRQAFIVTAIASALNQDYPDYDVVVVDDGSSDATLETIHSTFDDPRLKVITKAHSNAPDSRNMGIQQANGEYLVWLDSDDILHRRTLSHYNDLLRRWPDSDILSCAISQFGSEGHRHFCPPGLLAPTKWLDKIAFGNIITNPGCCVRKSLYDKVGGYDSRFYRAHDYEFWTRAAKDSNLVFTPQNNVHYRIHETNITGIGSRVDKTYEYRIFRQMVASYPLSALLPQLSRNKAEKYVTLCLKQLKEECKLDKLLIVIDAWGDELNELDRAFQALSTQQDSAFHTGVASDHDLSFLSVPTWRLPTRDPQALHEAIKLSDAGQYWHIVKMDGCTSLAPDTVSQIKTALLTQDTPLPPGFTFLRNRPALS